MGHKYYTAVIKANDEVIHQELILVDNQGITEDWDEGRVQFGLRDLILHSLFARDSMSPYSPVRKIREQTRDLKACCNYSLVPMDGEIAVLDEQYAKECEEKKLSGVFIFDVSFKWHLFGFLSSVNNEGRTTVYHENIHSHLGFVSE